jgi:nicotinate-nucleotide adenylyltransferase
LKKLSKKKYKGNIGIFGGTFDPPHEGHLHIATVGIKKLKLDNVMWVVTKKNPLKGKSFLSVNSRIKLSKVITKKEKKIFVKYLDKKIRSTNTFSLINYIKKKNKKKNLFFLIGADNLTNFHKWYNWEKIAKLAKIVVFARQKYSIKSLSPIVKKRMDKKEWIFINSKKINISSSLIRKL